VLQGIVSGVMTFWMRLRHQLKHPTPTTEIEFPILYLRVFMIYFWQTIVLVTGTVACSLERWLMMSYFNRPFLFVICGD
jgi:hypothetical protein